MEISFIIPVFNGVEYIDKCLESILSQHENSFEVLVIDDCSTDSTPDKLYTYEERDRRVRVIRNPENRLVGYCRNIGINSALGTYLWFVDADDWIDPGSVSHILKIIRANNGQELLSFGYAEHYHDKNASIIYKIPVPGPHTKEPPLLNFMLIRKGYSSMPFSYLFRRDFLLSNSLYFPEGIFFEDLLFMGKVFYFVKKLKLIPRVFYNYNRTNNNSITLLHTKKKIMDLLAVYEMLLSFLRSRNILSEYQGLLAYRFLVYGLPRCYRMFMRLARKERKDQALRDTLFKYRRSDLMHIKAIRHALVLVCRYSGNDPFQKMELMANLRYLITIKCALRIVELKWDIIEIFRKIQKSVLAIGSAN